MPLSAGDKLGPYEILAFLGGADPRLVDLKRRVGMPE
jgi:hypothetical protein